MKKQHWNVNWTLTNKNDVKFEKKYDVFKRIAFENVWKMLAIYSDLKWLSFLASTPLCVCVFRYNQCVYDSRILIQS